MTKRTQTLPLRRIFVAAWFAVALLAAVVALRPWEERLLADRLTEELATLSDEAAGDAVRRLALVGDSALPALVQSLGSERASVAEAARGVLLEEIDYWELLSAHESSPKLATLARSLAAEVDRFGPSSRGLAAELAERILRWPTDTHAIDRSELIANCSAVLDRTAPDLLRADLLRVEVTERSLLTPADASRFVQAASPHAPSEASESQVLAMTKLPGGGLPIESFEVPASPPRELIAGPFGVGTPRTSPPGRGPASVLAPGDQPPPDKLPITSSARPVPGVSGRASGGGLLRADDPEGPHVPRLLGGGELWRELPNLGSIDLMRLLHNIDARLTEGAEAELVHRGFSDVEVELGRRLTDADPAVRRKLIDTLPRIPGLNPKPWLLWLSEDSAAEVRRSALTLMATSSDLDLLRRVEDVARRDPDPRIAELADRLLERRRAAARR